MPPIDKTEPALIRVGPARLSVGLAGTAILIVLMGMFAHVARHQLIGDLEDPRADILRRLDIVEEPSLSQWYSSSLHLIASFVSLGIGLSFGRCMRWRWFGLAALFCYASIDEAIMIHEMMDRPVKEALGTSGFLAIAWILPGSLFALLIAAGYITFLLRLDRRIAILIGCAGLIFLSGAILMEIPGGYLYEKYGFSSWHYIASYAIEEALEMLGIVLFIYALLNFIGIHARQKGGLRFKIEVAFSNSGDGP